MEGERHLLGDALRPPADSPFIARNRAHQPIAVWPYGNTWAPHGLIIGGTGSGKTSFARSALLDLVRTPGEKLIACCDGKGADSFLFLLDQPGVVAVANTAKTIAEVVTSFFEDVEARYALLAEAKGAALKTRMRPRLELPPPHYLWLDEFINWALSLGDKQRAEVFDDLKRAALTGRQVRCYLRLLTQRPDSDRAADAGLPGKVKAVLDARVALVGRLGLRPLESRMAFGDDQSDAGKRIQRYADEAGLVGDQRKGLGLLRIGNEEVAFKTPWIADPLDPETTDADRDYTWGLLPPAERAEGVPA